MNSYKHLLWVVLLLAACDGNPLGGETDPDPDPVPDPDTPSTGINSDGAPVTSGTPSRERTIFRRERKDAEGNGYVAGVAYTAASGSTPESFSVDGLAFDGGNVYQRDDVVDSLGPFAVYEADTIYNDDVTGIPIGQFSHRAIYGKSSTGKTEFAVVRTGAYIPYGFGGFVYQRNGSVTMPTVGQATYSGDYAGLRDFNGKGGLEYATGKMTLDIDFNDFNDGDAVKGVVYDRAILDIDGQDITGDVISALNEANDGSLSQLPALLFTVGPGVLDANGEIGGTLGSYVTSTGGASKTYESGTYYAVISGDATAGGEDEIVGVIVVEADDPRFDGVAVRETGGFLLYRAPD